MPLSSGRLDVRDKFQPSPVKNKRMVKLRICIQRITKKKKNKKKKAEFELRGPNFQNAFSFRIVHGPVSLIEILK